MRKIAYLLHGFLFTVGSVVAVSITYPPAKKFFPPTDFIVPAIILIILFGLLFILSRGLTGDASLAGIVTTLFVLALFYQWILNALAVGCILLGLIIFYVVRRRMVSQENIHVISSLVSIIMVGSFFYQFLIISVIPSLHIRTLTMPDVLGDQQEIQPLADQPDIYYIILDGYGQAEMLQALHGYDNSNFISALQARGFLVASHSRSNYPRTSLSLASSLNMQYLDLLAYSMGDSDLWWPLIDIIRQSQVRLVLEKAGYRFVSVASGWDFTNISNADVYEKPYLVVLNDFQKGFLQSNNLHYLGSLDQSLFSFPSYNEYRRMILYAFEVLPKVASTPGPTFTFVHILAPHPPFVFDENGGPINPDYPLSLFDKSTLFDSLADYRDGYFSELVFINRMTLSAVDAIIASSKIPPVIIIQGDHGPGMIGDYDVLEKACLYERFSIMNAYYLPNSTPGLIPDDISPVNTFRVVFNEYLGTDFKLLPNKQYYSPIETMYKFTDVTTQIGSTCETPENNLP